MGIINDYSMHIVMPGNQEHLWEKMLKNRKCVYIKTGSPGKDTSMISYVNYSNFLSLMSEDHPNSFFGFSDKRGDNEELIDEKTRESKIESHKDISSAKDALDIVRNEDLNFSVSYYQHNGNTEKIINQRFVENILLLHENEDEWWMYDDFYDVKVFLRRIGDDTTSKYIEPIDIRDLNLNNRIIRFLSKGSYDFDKDALVAQYSMVSQELQAQYFVTKFFSNPLWSANPVCIFIYRISAFVLPGMVPWTEADEYPKKKTALNVADGSRYVIDSIHFNSDICYDWAEFKQLIDFHYYEIAIE